MTMATRIAVMKDASCSKLIRRQCCTTIPAGLRCRFHRQPIHELLDVTLVDQDGKLFVDGGTFKLEVPEARRQPTYRTRASR